MAQIIGKYAMRFRSALASACGKMDVGVGEGAIKDAEMSKEELGSIVAEHFYDLIDGGANIVKVNDFYLYAVRRGNQLDIGNRDDFEELGWGKVCDLLDQQIT